MSNKSGISDQVLSLPSGGGALKGIGETFSPDLFTGTGNLSVPLDLPPGRNGFAPRLSLGYSTGNANGPFGLGWQLSVPGVTRKTSKGVPRYRDRSADLSQRDTFVLSGAEDLVQITEAAGIARFRPRTEGLFARIERDRSPGNDVWRVRSRDGLVSLYGTLGAAGQDPAALGDPVNRARVFEWRLSQTTDPCGNRIEYEYLDDASRDPARRWAQVYPKRIRYVDYDRDGQPRFLVSVAFVYEQRPDAFSHCRGGFEVRTRLRCRRIEVRTHADDDLLVRTYELAYLDDTPDTDRPANGVSLLRQIQVVGHDGDAREALAPLQFGYSPFENDRGTIQSLAAATGRLPGQSLASGDLELVDLFGNGLPDLVQMNGEARLWRNLGSGRFAAPELMPEVPALVHLADPGVHMADLNGDGRVDLLAQNLGGYFPLGFEGRWNARAFVRYDHLPSVALDGPDTRLMDLDGDGVVDALRTGAQEGFELLFNHPTAGWERIETRPPLADFPGLSLADPRVKLGDLNGDGLQDLVLVQEGEIGYWPYLGHGQWGSRLTMDPGPAGLPPPGEDFDPARVLLGDVDGDGLDDLVYIQPRRITIWINQSGNGWSDPIHLEDTPLIADLHAVRLADMLGTGTAGILWSTDVPQRGAASYQFLDLTNGVKPYLLNQVDNTMGAVTRIRCVPSTRFYVADAERQATRWKTPLPFPVQVVERVEVIDEISRGKLTTTYRYHHGYWDGAEREFRGFGQVEQIDTETFEDFNAPGLHGTATAFEPVATRSFSAPVLMKTWFHLGPVGDEFAERSEADFSPAYWHGDPPAVPRPTETVQLLRSTPASHRADAIRSLRGQVMRTELYALDGTEREDRPFTVTESQYGIREESPPAVGDSARRRIFFPHPVATRTTQWERGEDPMTQFAFTGGYDRYGFAGQQLAVAVPRRRNAAQPDAAATQPYLATFLTTEYARRDDAERYIVNRVARSTGYEVVNDGRPSALQLRDAVLAGTANGALRVTSHSRTHYDGDAYVGLPLGQIGSFGLPVRSESLAFTDDFLDRTFGASDALAVPPRPPYLEPGGRTAWTAEYPPEFQALLADRAGYEHYGDGDVPDSPAGYYIVTARRRYDVHDAARVPRGLPLSSRNPLGAESRVDYDAFDLLPVRSHDAIGLVTQASNDYRALQPHALTDANGNTTSVTYSPAGFVTARYARGKNGEGDAIAPSTRMTYDLLAFADRGQPVSVRSTRRMHHDTQTGVPVEERDEVIVSVQYSDGFGRVLQTRAQAEDTLFGDPIFGGGAISPDQSQPVTATVGRPRKPGEPDNVIVSGSQTYDNKGQVVERYEPFFSTGYDFVAPIDAQLGQKASMFYDPRGHAVRTVNPDGTQQLVVLGVPVDLANPDVYAPTAWESFTYDANDNAGRTHPEEAMGYQSHWNTPASSQLDALGRTVLAIARNGPDPSTDWFTTRSTYDIQGNLIAITDALGRTAFEYRFDLARRLWRMHSIDAGRHDSILDALGDAVECRDGKGSLTLGAFDVLRRPTRAWARDDAGGSVTLRQSLEYGDGGDSGQPVEARQTAQAHNLLGRLVAHYDEAGLVTISDVDFKGNVLDTSRSVIADAPILAAFDQASANQWRVTPFQVDWQPAVGQGRAERAAVLLEASAYQTSTSFDALNRVSRQILPRDTEGRRRELRPRYNRAGGLEQVRLDDDIYVERIAYDAKGQRTLIAYGNGVMTRYAHHPHTFRLTRLRSERYTKPDELHYEQTGEVLQDLGYDYDVAGNIRMIRDRAPGSGILGNPQAFAAARHGVGTLLASGDALDRVFTYDPLYRLRTATGRECDAAPEGSPWLDSPRCADLTRTRAYAETYRYDAMGNMLELGHRDNVSRRGFTRDFTVESAANRLRRTQIGQAGYDYAFDASGNMCSETTSRHFHWNHANQLKAFRTQTEGAEPSVHAHYLYNAAGDRVKKLVRKQGGAIEVTHYLGAIFEHHRWSIAATASAATKAVAENNHVHVMDDRQRIASVRLGAAHPDDRGPAIAFQLGDHLASSTAVLDRTGTVTNREEYTPYGETSFGSYTRKRYRFTGQERDEESGLNYHAARYYVAWLARWASCDPIGPADMANLYVYARNSPLHFADSSGTEPEKAQTSGAADSHDDHQTQMGGSSAVGVKDSAHREVYKARARAASKRALDVIDNLSKTPGNEEAAAKAALDASKTRNALRTQTRAKLSPGALAVSEAFDKPMGLSELWKKYKFAASESYENAIVIATKAGSSNKWFSRAARGLGVASAVALVYGLYKGVQRIESTPAGQRPGVIGEETGGFGVGMLASIGGGALAAGALATSPAWVLAGGVFLAGLAFGYVGSRIGSWVGGAIGRIWDSPVAEVPIVDLSTEEHFGPATSVAHEVMPSAQTPATGASPGLSPLMRMRGDATPSRLPTKPFLSVTKSM
jgi:RHS repeat-associated protein